MKVFGTIVKIVVALAAIAGAVYLAATYGERVVAWARKALRAFKARHGGCAVDIDMSDVIAADMDFEG